MSHVEIVEVSPRDGLQNETTLLDTATKVELIRRLIEAGARRIEAASFVHPRLVPQMADAEAVMATLQAEVPRREGLSYIGLVLNRRGLERALAAAVDEVNAVVATTETFCRRNQGTGLDGVLDTWLDVAQGAHAAGVRVSLTVSTAFGCPFEGEVSPEQVGEVIHRAMPGRPDEIAIADTIGVGVPAQVRELVRVVREIAPRVPVRAHFHNTRNTGYANALAAYDEGVSVLDSSAGGVGGCPFAPRATGNIATEDLLYALHRSGATTGLELGAVANVGTWLGAQLGKDRVPAQLGRAGSFPEVADNASAAGAAATE